MDASIHLVRLADLNSLSEVWEVSGEFLGLEISEGELIPILIESDGETASLLEMNLQAEQKFPGQDDLDIIITIHETPAGNKIDICQLDEACTPTAQSLRRCWWTYTDEYKEQMH